MIDQRLVVIVLFVLGALLVAGIAVMAYGRLDPESKPNFLLRHPKTVQAAAIILLTAIVSFSGYFSSHG